MGSGVTKSKQQEKRKEVVESEGEDSDKGSNNNNNNMPLAQKCAASLASVNSAKQLRTVASKEGEKEMEDVEMREQTLLAMIAEAELVASNMEVKCEEEFEAAAIDMEEDQVSGFFC
ncbi:hypothetical protein C0989_001802 [Termitomyces sp. Mn162]|nr:hypothetical protein C0989_001802 [Termitomyces sp. Mn162]